jgi:hypothetical protein
MLSNSTLAVLKTQLCVRTQDLALKYGGILMSGRRRVQCSVAVTAKGRCDRPRLVKALGTPGFVIALLEDVVTIGGSLWVSNFQP